MLACVPQVGNTEGCRALAQQIRQAYEQLRSKLELFMQLEARRKQCLAGHQ